MLLLRGFLLGKSNEMRITRTAAEPKEIPVCVTEDRHENCAVKFWSDMVRIGSFGRTEFDSFVVTNLSPKFRLPATCSLSFKRHIAVDQKHFLARIRVKRVWVILYDVDVDSVAVGAFDHRLSERSHFCFA